MNPFLVSGEMFADSLQESPVAALQLLFKEMNVLLAPDFVLTALFLI